MNPVVLKKIILSLLTVLMCILNINGQTFFAILVGAIVLVGIFLPDKKERASE